MLDKGTPTSGEGVSEGGLINPSQFPVKSTDMYPSQIEESATRLRAMGKSVRTQVVDIDSSWGRLKAHYEAPEQQRVYDLMDPAVRSARDLKSTLSKAAGHLDVYASTLHCLKPRLQKLEKDANDFRARVSGGVTVDASDAKDASFGDLAMGGLNWIGDQDWIPRSYSGSVSERQVTVPWKEHDPSVQENNALVARLFALVEEVSRAATTCANDINDLVESWSPSEKKPMTAEALSAPGQKPMPWGSIVEEDRNCPEAVGHGNSLAARAAGEELQGLATLAVGYNPDTGGIFDLGAAHQARMGLADVGLSTVVTVATQRLRTPEGSVPWLERRRDVTATAWGEAIGYDHQAQKQYGNGFHEWKDDPIAMSTKVAWTAVPTLLTAGWGGAAKGGLSATGKAAKGVPDGAPKKVPHSWRTGVNGAPLARLDADIEARGKAYPSGHGPGKATNSLLDAVDDVPPPRKSPDAPVSNSINTERSTPAARGQGPESGQTSGSGDRGAGQGLGSGVEPRRTVSHREAPSPWTPDDVQAARERAGGVDHRTREPLRPDGPNGERRWHMTWDPEAREWVAENPGHGHTKPGDLPATGTPNSFGYDGDGNLMQYANERPSIPDSVVRAVWERDSQLDEKNRRYIDLRDNDGNVKRVYWEPGQSRLPGDDYPGWDMGHERGREYRKLREAYLSHKISKEEFLKQCKNPENYRVELPSVNRSRVNEAPDGAWPGLDGAERGS